MTLMMVNNLSNSPTFSLKIILQIYWQDKRDDKRKKHIRDSGWVS